MSARPRKRFPSPTFVGILLGIGGALFVPPPMMLTDWGNVQWFSWWVLFGLIAGVVVEVLIALARRRWDS